MKRRRHTPEQVVRKLRTADALLAEGKDLAEVARALENGRLKKLLAEAELDKSMLKELAEGNF